MNNLTNITIVIGICSLLLNACDSGRAASTNSANSHASANPLTLNYPSTPKVNVVDNYHGTSIPDPYRWLESTMAPNVLAWVNEQNTFTQNYFEHLANYAQITSQINAIYGTTGNRTKRSVSFAQQSKTIVKGKGVYFYQINRQENLTRKRNIPGNKPPVTISEDNIVYITDNPEHQGQVFLDLNKLYPKDVINLTAITAFAEGRYLGVALSRNHSDLADLLIFDFANQQQVATIPNTFGEMVPWKNGFFYVTIGDAVNPLLSSYNNDYLNYFYLDDNGNPQLTTVFKGNSQVLVTVNSIDKVNSQLYFSTSMGTNNNLYRVDLNQPTWQPGIFIDDGFLHSYNILNIINDRAIIMTNSGARRLRLISVNLNDPQPGSWQNILPEAGSNNIINGIYPCGNKYIVDSIDDKGFSKMAQYSQAGSFEHDISLPGSGAVNIFSNACDNESSFIYSYSNLVTPNQYINYNPLTGKGSTYSSLEVPTFNPDDYEMKGVSVPSTGGATVNIFLAYKKGLQLNGKNPAYMYVYGGFDLPILADFDRRDVFLLEHGGVYAVAQVRGGSEQGTNWYNDGRLLNKQNTYDDTIAVAEYLIKSGYTSRAKLGLGGDSNGGTTSAAVALQRPDLFQVAFPAVGVLDLLRYNLFTFGFSWYPDYGSSNIQDEFNNMMKFSPLQNIRAQSYPAMYIQTAQQDTRVPPLHSYKFAATLQKVATGSNPYLLYSYPNSSHFLENNMEQVETAKTWAFFFANTHSPLTPAH